MKATALAPTNIAVIKYWGKEPSLENYHVPTKSSYSFTVDSLYAKTSIEAEELIGRGGISITLTLNGKVFETGSKEHSYIESFFKRAISVFPFLDGYKYNIVSETNFPVAAGLASSAAGFAALAKALAQLFPSQLSSERDVSILARLGSGSAARSVPEKGGIVVWHRGDLKDHKTSYAETLFPPEHLEDLRIVYALVEKEEKKVKSRGGMKTSLLTNPLYKDWVAYEEENLSKDFVSAVSNKDTGRMYEIIMRASNNLHMMCMGTYPPIMYLKESSFSIMDDIHKLNKDSLVAAYTFDAGPNPIVFTQEENLKEVISLLSNYTSDIIITKQGRGAISEV
ncbi:MAG: diphosphomevalonate decarboxylase [Methanobacteriota archaeon]|nr:MAG: diphosphomevalonate decarboxylase [Euryarchaeota archaeon]